MEVVLSKEYTNKLKKEISNIVIDVLKYEAEKLAPPKRFFTKTELMRFLKIGEDKFTKLREQGLKVIIIEHQKHLYDIEDVYSILDSLKK